MSGGLIGPCRRILLCDILVQAAGMRKLALEKRITGAEVTDSDPQSRPRPCPGPCTVQRPPKLPPYPSNPFYSISLAFCAIRTSEI